MMALPRSTMWREAAKLAAFLRRDLLVTLSYRFAFVSDVANLVAQTFMFFFVGLLVDQRKMPSFGGTQASYMAFVVVGIAVSAFLQVGLGRMVYAIRNEQLMGTLESLFMTPTSETTILFGLVVYDLLYVPIRTLVFLGLVAALFGVDLNLAGMGPTTLVLALFIPFVWGLGAATAAAVVRFRSVPGLIGLGGYALAATSGAYFPLNLLPGWLGDLARYNPVAIALHGARGALLGGVGWAGVLPDVLLLAPMAGVSLVVGMLSFRLALRWERRSGTLGIY